MGYHGILWDIMGRDNHNYETTDDQSLDPFFLYIHIIITFIASHCSGPFDQICLRNFGTRLSLDHGWDVTGHLYLSSAPTLRRHPCRGFRDVSQRLRQTRQTRSPRHDFQASKDVTLGIGDGLSLLLGWWRMVKDGEGFKIQACNEFPIQDHVWYLIVWSSDSIESETT